MLGVILILVLLIPILAIILDSHVGQALAARLEKGTQAGEVRGLQERIAYLEGEVERLARELERLDEANEFLQGLLEGREERSGRLPPGDSGP